MEMFNIQEERVSISPMGFKNDKTLDKGAARG
jgi:hypothetical protein